MVLNKHYLNDNRVYSKLLHRRRCIQRDWIEVGCVPVHRYRTYSMILWINRKLRSDHDICRYKLDLFSAFPSHWYWAETVIARMNDEVSWIKYSVANASRTRPVRSRFQCDTPITWHLRLSDLLLIHVVWCDLIVRTKIEILASFLLDWYQCFIRYHLDDHLENKANEKYLIIDSNVIRFNSKAWVNYCGDQCSKPFLYGKRHI